MANSKRQKRSSAGAPTIIAPAAQVPPKDTQPAGQPEPQARQAYAADRTAESLGRERAAMARRRAATFAGLGLAALLIAFLGYRLLAPQPAPTAAVPVLTAQPAPTAAPAPTAQPAPTAAAPVAAASTAQAAPTAQPAPTAAPAPAAAAPTAAPIAAQPGVAITCNAIAGVPIYTGATCTDQDTDSDDGVLKLKNTYVAAATVDEVRRFYEGSFGQNSWTLGEFKYDINLGQRSVKIEVTTDLGPNGVFTKVQLTENGAPAATGTTCASIAGLPALPNATCIEFDPDLDNGVLQTKNTYATTASPEEVRRFYESALAQNGWAPQESQYDVRQGLRRVQIDVGSQLGPQGSFTELKIEEK